MRVIRLLNFLILNHDRPIDRSLIDRYAVAFLVTELFVDNEVKKQTYLVMKLT